MLLPYLSYHILINIILIITLMFNNNKLASLTSRLELSNEATLL
jgi:hypothetical protein